MMNFFKISKLFKNWEMGPVRDNDTVGGRGAIVAGSFAINILGLAFPLFMLQVYDRILPFRSYDTLFVMSFGVLCSILLESYLRYYRSEISNHFAAKFEHNAMIRLLSKNFSRPSNETEKMGPGRIMESFRAVTILKSHYSGQNFQHILDFPFVLIYIAVVIAISPLIGSIIVTGYLCFFLMSRFWLLSFPSTVEQYQELESRRTNFLTECFKNSHTLKSLSMEATMMRRYERLAKSSAELHARITYLIEISSAIGVAFSAILSATAISLGAFLSIRGEITNGELAAIVLLTLRCAAPVQKFSGVFARQMQDAVLDSTFSTEIQISEASFGLMSGPENQCSREVVNSKHSLTAIQFENVSFKYDSEGQEVVGSCDFNFEAGEFILLTGASGSGRSTVLDLIAGFLKPTKGCITFKSSNQDDKILKKDYVDIGYLSSTSEFFNGTLLENAAMFRNENIEKINDISRKMGADSIVSSLPFGWNTVVGDRVVEVLPLGWAQHLMAVRLFSTFPDVILIDNATNSFDVSQERKFYDFLKSMKGRATFILVSDQTIFRDLADRFCIIDEGVIKTVPIGDFSPEKNITAAAMSAKSSSLTVCSEIQGYVLEDGFSQTIQQVFKIQNDLSTCLPILLEEIGFKGSVRDVSEALPYFEKSLTLDEFNNTIARLGYRAEERRGRLDQIDARLLPCLFVPDGDQAFVVSGRSGKSYIVDGQSERSIDQLPLGSQSGTIYRYQLETASENRSKDWVHSVFYRFSKFYPNLVFIGLLNGLLALASSLFLIIVYGSIIPSNSITFLIEMFIGVAIAILIGFAALRLKATILRYISGRFDYLMSTSILERVFMMPPPYTERASIGGQYARIKGFEGLRDIFHGPIGSIVAELPTTLVVSVALFIINPLAALVFFLAIAMYYIAHKFMYERISKAVETAGGAAAERNEFLIETIFKIRSIREVGAQSIWLERMRSISAFAVESGSRVAKLTALSYSIGYTIMMAAGLAIVAITIPAVWEGSASSVVLIVSMTLMWRVLNPAQAIFANLTKVEGLIAAKRQINALMQVSVERATPATSTGHKKFEGRIEFSKVSFRYSAQADPSLLGADFKINPGEIVAIAGANGSGKSTVMALILGMYRPQAGSIMLDAVDSRQIDPIQIRRAMGYSPQQIQMFRATIMQNLMFSRPDASIDQIWAALEMSGAADGVRKLPANLGHRLGDGRNELPLSLLRQISLARAYLSDAPFLLLDEPTEALPKESERLFLEVLDSFRGIKTVLFSSHKASHLLRADKVILLDKGYVRAVAPPNELFKVSSMKSENHG